MPKHIIDSGNQNISGDLSLSGNLSASNIGSSSAKNYTQSDTPPSNPQTGDQWLNTSTMQKYDYYDGFWVETAGAAVTPESVGVALASVTNIDSPKTFTGQVELTGQAATNATSAMTRGLGDARHPRVIYSSGVKASRPATVGSHTLASVTIPGGSLGANGWLEIRCLITGLNTATVGTRYNVIYFGTEVLKQHSPTASVNYNISQYIVVHNRNSESSQIMSTRNDRPDFSWGQYAGVGAGGDAGVMQIAVNTSNSFTIRIVNTSVDASDTAHLQFLQVIAYYAP